MPKKTPSAPPDTAPITLTCTSVRVKTTATPVARAKRTIHARRPAPVVPKGEPVADATPSEPVRIERPAAKSPRRARRGQP